MADSAFEQSVLFAPSALQITRHDIDVLAKARVFCEYIVLQQRESDNILQHLGFEEQDFVNLAGEYGIVLRGTMHTTWTAHILLENIPARAALDEYTSPVGAIIGLADMFFRIR